MKKVYSNLIQPSIDLIETTNLFEVSMGKVTDEYGKLDEASSEYYTKAIAFQEKMNEKLATNKKEVMEYQAKYFSMFKSQNIDLNKAYLMSESLTKAGYDIASLYNLSTEQAMEKIRAGIAGQVEPLRAIGIDISESALTKVIKNAGIERSVQQLSYAEKEVARYIAIVEQAKQAQGDFARTFESPANQVRIFKNQLEELKQVAGSFLIGVFGNVLTYVNAIIMTLKEILKSFSSLFGIELNYTGNLSSGFGDVSDSIIDASDNAKKFKNQLMGFDEINNITLPDTSSSSGSSATGIDDKLLQSLKEWDNKMDSISGKAQEIRDKMLDWLGFERDDDGTWKLKEGYSNLEKILDIAQTLGMIFLGYKISSSILTFLDKLGALPKATNIFRLATGFSLDIGGLWLLYKGTKHAIDVQNIDGQSIIEMLSGGALVSSGTALMFKNVAILKIGLLATLDIVMLTSIVTWWNKYFDEWKEKLYGEKKELNLGEMINVGLSSVGTGIIENVIEPLFGENAMQPIVEWTANVILWFRKLGKNIETWWKEDIAPWFTKEKWEQLGENIKTGLSNKWNEFKDWWNNIALFRWWNENVSPWFTKEKWQNIASNAKTGLEAKFNEWKNNFNPISNWWDTKIAPWFTKEKWKTLADNAVQGIQNVFSNFDFKIKMPHFSWTSTPVEGWIADVLKVLNLPLRIPKLNVSWYANGGMPDMGEIFVAREQGPEMVGKIGNRTAVANNGQIVTAIKQGVYEAVSSAMANGSNEVRLDIRTEEGVIVRKVSQGFKDYVTQTGELPFPIPV